MKDLLSMNFLSLAHLHILLKCRMQVTLDLSHSHAMAVNTQICLQMQHVLMSS